MTEETEEKVENVLQDLFWKLVELRVRSSCQPSVGQWGKEVVLGASETQLKEEIEQM